MSSTSENNAVPTGPIQSPVVVVVDPYSSGDKLSETLQNQGARCIAVISHPLPDHSLRKSFRPEFFDTVVEHHGDLQATADRLELEKPTDVVAGFAPGIELADHLSERLHLRTNGSALSAQRNDKFLMHDAIRTAGLRAAKQFVSDDVDQLLTWARDEMGWPVVVKPVKSIGSDHVALCRDEAELRAAAQAILEEPNRLGRQNHAIVAQEFLDGVEHVVDTVSHNGRHKVTAFWEYNRPAENFGRVWYDSMSLIDYDGPRQQSMRRYTFAVLNALGIRFGPAHCEIMWVNGEPVLVEINVRLTAGINAVLSRMCGGPCQLDEAVSAILEPSRFLAGLDAPSQLDRRAASVFLFPPRSGRLAAIRGAEQLEKLPSFHKMSISARPGEPVPSCAGMITLIADGQAGLTEDIRSIRALERNGLFELEEPQLVN